jgi:hypothetical protein
VAVAVFVVLVFIVGDRVPRNLVQSKQGCQHGSKAVNYFIKFVRGPVVLVVIEPRVKDSLIGILVIRCCCNSRIRYFVDIGTAAICRYGIESCILTCLVCPRGLEHKRRRESAHIGSVRAVTADSYGYFLRRHRRVLYRNSAFSRRLQ